MRVFLPVEEKKGTEEELKKAFVEHIKKKICDIKKLWMYEVLKDQDKDAIKGSESTLNHQTLSYHVPTCNEIVSLTSKAYSSVYTRIEVFL